MKHFIYILFFLSAFVSAQTTINISTVQVGGQNIPTDGTTPINDWWNQANSQASSGDTVFFDVAGPFVIEHPVSGGAEAGFGLSYIDQLYIKGGVTFDGNNVTISLKDGSYNSYGSINLQGSNAVIKNFELDGNVSGITGDPCIGCSSMIHAGEGVVNPTVENVIIRNTTQVAITFDRAVNGWTIKDSEFYDIYEHVIYASSGFDGDGLLENIIVDEWALEPFAGGRDVNIYKSSAYDQVNNGTGTGDGTLTVRNVQVRRERTDTENTNIINFTTSSKYAPTIFDNFDWTGTNGSYNGFYMLYAGDDDQIIYIRNSDLGGRPLFYDVVQTDDVVGYGYKSAGATETNEHYFIENSSNIDIGRWPQLISGWNGGTVTVSDVISNSAYGRVSGVGINPNLSGGAAINDGQDLVPIEVKFSNLTWSNQATMAYPRMDSDVTFNGVDFTQSDGNPVMTMYESRGGQTARTIRVKNCNCNLTNGSTLLNAAASTNTIVIFENNNTGNCDLVSNEGNYASVTRNAASTGGTDPLPGGGGSVAVTGVTVAPSTATINENETTQLSRTIAPANATDQTGTWSTSNASVATVSTNGLVTGESAGSATITYTTNDGSFTDTSVITVNSVGGGGGPVTYGQVFSSVTGLSVPVELVNDGSNRMFVVEQSGLIKVFDRTAGTPTASTFLDLTGTVSFSSGQEIGLLGLAFHPNYASNGYFYVYYTDQPSNYRINIVRYTRSTDTSANAGSAFVIYQATKNQGDSNHNGGKIAFGPDGYLYASVGDGGGAVDPQENAQNLSSPFGKMLRFDVDGGSPYAIPAGNPTGTTGLDEIYAWGLRNTWKFSFGPDGTLWGGDVGQQEYGEINHIVAGGNYGWDVREGPIDPPYGDQGTLSTTPAIDPVVFNDWGVDGNLSITGGYVFEKAGSDLTGNYIFGDYVSGRIYEWDGTTKTELFDTPANISSFGVDNADNMYFVDYASGAIYEIDGGGTTITPNTIAGQGNFTTVSGLSNSIKKILLVDETYYIVHGNTVSRYTGTLSTFATANGQIEAIAERNGVIYIGGSFTQINGNTANNVARYDGSWSALANGTDGNVDELVVDSSGNLYAGGVFVTASGVTVNNIAMWNGTAWSALGSGLNNEVRSLAVDGTTVYIGGNFDTAGGVSAPRIAVWNGSTFSTLDNGTSGFVYDIEITPTDIFLGGNFSFADGQTVNRIVRYDRGTQQFETMEEGLSGAVNALYHDGTYLYAGGNFPWSYPTVTTPDIVNNIARWSSGTGWQALGSGVGLDGGVNAMDGDGTQILVGGDFTNRLEGWRLNGSFNVNVEAEIGDLNPSYYLLID